jgi:hypothetical protein
MYELTLPRGAQKGLAAELGVDPVYLNSVLKRRRTAGRNLARALEKWCGIPMSAWSDGNFQVITTPYVDKVSVADPLGLGIVPCALTDAKSIGTGSVQ